MTELEAHSKLEQLKRIWGPEATALGKEGVGPRWYSDLGSFYFNVPLTKLVNMWLEVNGGGYVFSLTRLPILPELNGNPQQEDESSTNLIALSYDHYTGRIHNEVPYPGESGTQFVAEWMPFFRRGLWLSGCPIEASDSEKAEWMRGFSHEEIESWDLKI